LDLDYTVLALEPWNFL